MLGPIGHRLIWTTTVAPADWHTRPKGSVDREAMTDVLIDAYRAEQVP
jgi:hypothetical protein